MFEWDVEIDFTLDLQNLIVVIFVFFCVFSRIIGGDDDGDGGDGAPRIILLSCPFPNHRAQGINIL